MKIKRCDTQINVSMPHDLKASVEDIAAKHKLSMSEFVRAAIEERIRRMENRSK